MTFVIPLAVAAGLAIFGLMAGRKKEEGAPALPGEPSKELPPGGSEVHPDVGVSAPPGALPSGTTPKTGDTAVAHADDSFDQAVATAIANKDIPTLTMLANKAVMMGLNTVAASIRDEIARLTSSPPIPTPKTPDKPVVTSTLATYVIRAGDTGSSIAKNYTGNPNRWPELVTVNPSTKDAKIGFKASVGQRINLPASWPAGIPVVTAAPGVPPPPTAVLGTYTVRAGDTGEKVAEAFTGDKNRWKELLTVNPTLKSAKYGISLYAGHKINLPSNWPTNPAHPVVSAPAVTAPVPVPQLPAPPAPTPIQPEPVMSPPENDGRAAARDLTAYLTSIGGLKARFKEDRSKVSGFLSRMGVPDPKGMYGVGAATAVMSNGFVPVVPFYWASTGTATQKRNFTTLVQSYAAADPQRAEQWKALLADIVRS